MCQVYSQQGHPVRFIHMGFNTSNFDQPTAAVRANTGQNLTPITCVANQTNLATGMGSDKQFIAMN